MTDKYKHRYLRNEAVKADFENRYSNALGRSRETMEIFTEILDVTQQQLGSISTSQVVLNILMIQSYNEYWSGILLCSHGYIYPASSLLRNMVNRLIDSKYISDGDSEILSERWIEFSDLKLDQYFTRREKRGETIDDRLQETRIESEKQAKIYRGKYKGNHTDWSGKSIGAKAREVGLVNLYEELYWHLSNIAHSNSLASVSYYREHGRFRIGPLNEMVEETLDMMASVFLKQFDIWKKHLGLDLEEQERKLLPIWGAKVAENFDV